MIKKLGIIITLICCFNSLYLQAQKVSEADSLYCSQLQSKAKKYYQEGKIDSAFETTRIAIAEIKEKYGEKSIKYTLVLGNLGTLYQNIGKYTTALSIFEEVMRITRKT